MTPVRKPAMPKLSLDQAREIRAKRLDGASVQQLAREYGTNTATVSNICNGKSYRDPEGGGDTRQPWVDTAPYRPIGSSPAVLPPTGRGKRW